MIHIESARLRATIDDETGACVRGLDFLGRDQTWRPVLAAAKPEGGDAGASAMFVMFPFANRARDNVLRLAGREFNCEPNTADPLAIHGYAWQRRWAVETATESACRLRLEAHCDAQFPVALIQDFRLEASVLVVSLTAHNTGASSLPVGCGWHPYFPHTAETELRFDAQSFWLEGPGHLPTEPLKVPPELSFATSRKVPATWRNNCYQDWSGTATVLQPSLGYSLEMQASPNLRHLLLYTPQSNVFALEPQSHVSGFTEVGENGLRSLDPDKTLEAEVTFHVAEMPALNERQPTGTYR